MEEAGIHLFLGFRGVNFEEELKYLIREYRPGGIVLFKRNIEDAVQLKTLVSNAQALAIAELHRPVFFAVDQEGGSVQRLSPQFTYIPSARSLAESGRGAVAHWAAACAADLREIGIQINFAPVLDIVAEGKGHFMESRSFGSTAAIVSDLGAIWIETLQANGISATAKHFPGLGRAQLDPHHFAPVIPDQGEDDFQTHLIPFRSAVGVGVNCIMTSHAIYPAVDGSCPATLSHEIGRGWLRDRLGFEGALFTDDLDMAAISDNYSPEEIACLGLSCSTDFFLLCQKSGSIEPMYKALSDQLDRNRSLHSFHSDTIRRLEKLKGFHFAEQGRMN
ncbi:MAG TPA: glycoside hydrolase family 3 N-terminal domain-containing protein [Syntrophobacteraceae bacterium]|nr:glycoside hydrolase family 3 N-terminal domain-containing protein [Syntrophobacteraceae bacterium]